MRYTDPYQAVQAVAGRQPSSDNEHNWDLLETHVQRRDNNPRLRLVRCKSCSAICYWATRTDGSHSLRDLDGKGHSATCPDADKWRRAATCNRVGQNLEELRSAQQQQAVTDFIRTAWRLCTIQGEIIASLEDSGLNTGRLEDLRRRSDSGWRKLRELCGLLPEGQQP
jgi:hypothetical protein